MRQELFMARRLFGYSNDFAGIVAIEEYADHPPLEGQIRSMKRQGLVVDSQMLWERSNALAHR